MLTLMQDKILDREIGPRDVVPVVLENLNHIRMPQQITLLDYQDIHPFVQTKLLNKGGTMTF